MKGAGGTCPPAVGRSHREETVLQARERLARCFWGHLLGSSCSFWWKVPEKTALGVPSRPAATTPVPISEAHQFELCACWDFWPGAVSVQPGPLLRGGGAGTHRSVAHLGRERITSWTEKGTFFPKTD